MPVMFLISGIATYFALGKYPAGRFVKDRGLRLLVPFLVGLLTHLRLQEYLALVRQNRTSESFWQWYPSMFNGHEFLGGYFSWSQGHLWYLDVLFVLSLVSLPLVLWLRNGSGRQVLAWLNERCASPGAVYLLVLPICLLSAALNPDTGSYLAAENGGWNKPSYLLFLLSGFVIAASPAMQASIRRIRWVSLVTGVVVFFAGAGLILALGGAEAAFGTPLYLLWTVVSSLSAWACTLAILGFGMQHLNARTPGLDYANEAVLPFYVMHQTVLWVVGFYVLDWAIPDLVKWAVILASTLVIIMALYEFLIRRNNVLRVLFGMKAQASPRVAQTRETALAR
jgi:peptidoglycan/LPS O-acetylase OafA/YrhL